jgi:hypothetical protein
MQAVAAKFDTLNPNSVFAGFLPLCPEVMNHFSGPKQGPKPESR